MEISLPTSGPTGATLVCYIIISGRINDKNDSKSWKYGALEDNKELSKLMSSNVPDTCSACQSFSHNKAAIISNDDEYEVSFVSSLYPIQEEVFILLRQACIRSLSCEVYSEREGPIYFGDESRGHVISYTFFLKDVQARGFHRRYSILVLMKDKMFLLNSWAFFIKYIKDIIDCLKGYANKVYAIEDNSENNVENLQRLKTSIVCDSATKRRRSAGNPRSLTELVGVKNIWNEIHVKFTWILKAGAMRLQEKMVEGPPLVVASLERDQISLKSFINMVGSPFLKTILHTLYIGEKIILQAADINFINEFGLLIKNMLPSYLYRIKHVINWSEINDEANILMSNIDEAIPVSLQHVLTIFFEESFSMGTKENHKEDHLLPYHMKIHNPLPLLTRPPQIAVKISKLFENPNLSISVLNLCIAMLIDEWSNKVKVWTYMRKNQSNIDTSINISSSSHGVRRQTAFDKKFKTVLAGESFDSSSHISNYYSSMLLTVGALDCDIELLDELSKYSEM